MKKVMVLKLLKERPFLIGLLLRIAIMILLPLLLDDGILLQGVKYTDIDYDIFTDAARYAALGQSPFKRHTYRYTPFLALILSFGSDVDGAESNNILLWWKKERYFGKLLFCIADALCGLVILKLRKKSRDGKDVDSKARNLSVSVEMQDALWWLYNPFPINICTRGSAESFVVLLSVLGTVAIATMKVEGSKAWLWGKAGIAGIIHGLAIHAKLYPIIYTASFMAYFACQDEIMHNDKIVQDERVSTTRRSEYETSQNGEIDLKRGNDSFPWLEPRRILQLMRSWVYRIISPAPLIFLAMTISAFAALTYLAVYFYGQDALNEGLLYHFSRVDHRHNYSMVWYWIYLARSNLAKTGTEMASSSFPALGKLLLLPQLVLLLYSSLGIAPFDLSFALFVQTFFFVALNKVITAQYFTWYLVLLPLCSDRIRWGSKDVISALSLLGLSIIIWLGAAFCLEMKGMAVHLQVWIASLLFFAANVNVLRTILANYKGSGKQKME